jgi:hypothetical protein
MELLHCEFDSVVGVQWDTSLNYETLTTTFVVAGSLSGSFTITLLSQYLGEGQGCWLTDLG